MEPVSVLATVPAIIALVTIAKDLGLSPKLAPILSIFAGVALSAAQFYLLPGISPNETLGSNLAAGFILGLTASGLYDGAKVLSPVIADPLNNQKDKNNSN